MRGDRILVICLAALMYLPLPSQAQPSSIIRQNTLGYCSPAVADVRGSVTITCRGSDTDLLKQVLTQTSDMLNQLRSKDLSEISATLDQLLDTRPLETYYQALNSFERRLYLEEIEADPSREVSGIDAGGRPTPLGYDTWSAREVKIRVRALRQFSVYFKTLAQQQGIYLQNDSDWDIGSAPIDHRGAPEAVKDELSGSIAALVATLKSTDASSTVSGTILAGERYAAQFLELLKHDVGLTNLQLSTEIQEHMVMRVLDYNQNRAHMTREQRHAALSSIDKVVEQYLRLRDSDPVAEWLDGISRAYHDLIQTARLPASRQQRSRLAAALKVTADKVDRASRALRDFEGGLNPT